MSTDGVDGGDSDVGEAHVWIYRKHWLPIHLANPLDLVRM